MFCDVFCVTYCAAFYGMIFPDVTWFVVEHCRVIQYDFTHHTVILWVFMTFSHSDIHCSLSSIKHINFFLALTWYLSFPGFIFIAVNINLHLHRVCRKGNPPIHQSPRPGPTLRPPVPAVQLSSLIHHIQNSCDHQSTYFVQCSPSHPSSKPDPARSLVLSSTPRDRPS